MTESRRIRAFLVSAKYHILFWVGIASFTYLKYCFALATGLPKAVFFYLLLCLPPFYIVFNTVLSDLRRARNIKSRIIWLLPLFLLVIPYAYGIIYHILPVFGVVYYHPNKTFEIESFVVVIGIHFLKMILAATAFAVVIQYLRVLTQLGELKIRYEDLKLRYQIDDHLIGNVFALIGNWLVCRSMAAYQLIAQLREFIGFVGEISPEDAGLIKLNEEWKHTLLMIDIFREMKGTHRVFTVRGEPGEDWEIPKATLATFVENMYKYGDLSSAHPGIIAVKTSSHYCEIICKNKKARRATRSRLPSKGIGLSQVGRRLHLWLPDNHEIQITEDADEFEVRLRLNHTS